MVQLALANYLSHRSANPPQYDLYQVRFGVMHLVFCAFRRTHHVVYFERILRSGILGFGVAGVTQRSGGGADVMNSQDSLYCINEREGAGFAAIIVGDIRKAYCFPAAREQVLSIARSKYCELVTLTVSDKAYLIDAMRDGISLNTADVSAGIADLECLLSLPARRWMFEWRELNVGSR